MNCPIHPVIRWKASLALGLALFVTTTLAAQSTTGTIEGQVSNSARGENVERARVSVDGTLLETFTQDDGSYRLTNVPVGTATVKTFFTGFPVHTQNVPVVSGQVVRHDVDLAGTLKPANAGRDGDVVKLSEFLVNTSQEMDGAAIAINEQRFAPTSRKCRCAMAPRTPRAPRSARRSITASRPPIGCRSPTSTTTSISSC